MTVLMKEPSVGAVDELSDFDLLEFYKRGEYIKILEELGLEENILRRIAEHSPMRGYTGFDIDIHIKINIGGE